MLAFALSEFKLPYICELNWDSERVEMNPILLKSVLWAVCLAGQCVFLWPVFTGSIIDSGLLGLSVCALVAIQWNRKLRFSFSRLSGALLCLGLGISLLAGLSGLPWLGSWGILLSLTAFFADQSDKTSRSLLQLGFFFLAFISFPASLEIQLTELSTKTIVGTSQMILDATGTPHLAGDSEFQYIGRAVEVFSFPWITWRRCFLLCVLYSILRRRRWPTTLTNIANATFCWYSFTFMMVICPALVPGLSGLACLAVCFSISLLLFLSLERGVRTLLAPLPEDAEASKYANPLIEIWNRMDDPVVPAEPEQIRKPLIFSLCLAGLLIGCSHFIARGIGDPWPSDDESSQSRQIDSLVEGS